MNMELETEWARILSETNIGIDLHTLPLKRKEYLWFFVKSDGKHVIVTNSVNRQPSSILKNPRKISYKEFLGMYPLYFRRKNGEQVSNEAKLISRNQVYIYSLIGKFLD